MAIYEIYDFEIDDYNKARSKLCITIKNISKQDLKNEIVNEASGKLNGYVDGGFILGFGGVNGRINGDYNSKDKIVGTAILSFIHTKNNIELDDYHTKELYEIHNSKNLPHTIDKDFCSANNIDNASLFDYTYYSRRAIKDSATIKNDFSSVEIVAKQITDIEFKKSANDNSYYDICYPNTLYLNKEDWNKIIGI